MNNDIDISNESFKDADKAFYELGWCENESDAKLCFESGANWQKEKDKALKEALENLLESIPNQDNDHDWWPDELTRAVKEANKLLDSIQ